MTVQTTSFLMLHPTSPEEAGLALSYMVRLSTCGKVNGVIKLRVQHVVWITNFDVKKTPESDDSS